MGQISIAYIAMSTDLRIQQHYKEEKCLQNRNESNFIFTESAQPDRHLYLYGKLREPSFTPNLREVTSSLPTTTRQGITIESGILH